MSKNQDCAEAMLTKATQLVMEKSLQFCYEENVLDSQVDISPAFLFSPDEQKQLWFSGDNEKNLENDLNELDKDKVYFLRTGTNAGAGHWQTLYFDKMRKGWINYSTEVNTYQLTENNALTKLGIEGLICPYANWGSAKDQYVFLLVEASPQNLINAANYLYDFRLTGPEKADEKLGNPQENFYEALIKKEANDLAADNNQNKEAIEIQKTEVIGGNVIEELQPRQQQLYAYLQSNRLRFNELLNELKTKTNELIAQGEKGLDTKRRNLLLKD